MNTNQNELKDCPHCNGTGETTCPSCKGGGLFGSYPSFFTFIPPCYTCGGIGRTLCTFCDGTGKIVKKE